MRPIHPAPSGRAGRPRRLPRAAAAVAAAAFLSGCAAGDGPAAPAAAAAAQPVVRLSACEGPARSLAPALAAALAPPPHPYVDSEMAALSRRVPGGFAGVFFDAGRPVLWLTDPARAAAAKAALAAELPLFPTAAAEVRRARWDYAQLYEWHRYLLARGVMGADRGVVSADLDEGANRLHYGVRDEAARGHLAAWLAALDLPCDLALISLQEPIFSL